MGRAVKLKRQRKRQQKQQQQQQQRLNTLPFPSVFNLSEREIEQAFSALSDWVLERWSTVPQFVKYFTLSEAKKIALGNFIFIPCFSAQQPCSRLLPRIGRQRSL